MKTQNAIKKVKKTTGKEMNVNNNIYSVQIGKSVLSFIAQRNGEIMCISVGRVGDKSDPMTDYSAGTYVDNLKRGLELAQR